MARRHVHHRTWTPDEDQFLSDTLADPAEDVADVLNRTAYSIHARRFVLSNAEAVARANDRTRQLNAESAERASSNREVWSHDEDTFVLSTLDDPVEVVAEILGRTNSAVTTRR